jgi:hypothetical protein
MFIRTVVAGALALWTGNASAGNQWYVLAIDGCHPDGAPSSIISSWQKMGMPYTTQDVRDPVTSQIVQTTLRMTDSSIPIPPEYSNILMFRGLDRCEAFVSAGNANVDRAIQDAVNKYK